MSPPDDAEMAEVHKRVYAMLRTPIRSTGADPLKSTATSVAASTALVHVRPIDELPPGATLRSGRIDWARSATEGESLQLATAEAPTAELSAQQPPVATSASADILLNSKAAQQSAVPTTSVRVSGATWIDRYGLDAVSHAADPSAPKRRATTASTFVPTLDKHVSSRYFEGIGGAGARHIDESKAIMRKRLLRGVVASCRARLDWLTTESRQRCGVIVESSVCLVVDMSQGLAQHLEGLRQAIDSVLAEQISQCQRFNVVVFHAGHARSFANQLTAVTRDSIQDAREWLATLEPCDRPGVNTWSALKIALSDPQTEALYVISGNVPDQPVDLVFNMVQQLTVGRTLTINTVSYCAYAEADEFVRRLASLAPSPAATTASLSTKPSTTSSRVHVYQAVEARGGEGAMTQMCGGSDVEALTAELVRVQELLEKLEQQTSELDERKRSFRATRQMPRWMQTALRTGEYAINAQTRGMTLGVPRRRVLDFSGPPQTSTEWLRDHSLKARGLTLWAMLKPYLVLPGNDSAKKNGKEEEEKEEMITLQVKWGDGTIRRVRPPREVLERYVEQLDELTDLHVGRMGWLLEGSRAAFGCIRERRVCLLVDVSERIGMRSGRLLRHLQELLIEQLRHALLFNVIACGGRHGAVAWRRTAVAVSVANFDSAWEFLTSVRFGSRPALLDGLKLALADRSLEAMYVIAGDYPMREHELITSAVERASPSPRPIHTCAYGSTEAPVNTRLRELASRTHARYHYYGESRGAGHLLESDDMLVLRSEAASARAARIQALEWISQLDQMEEARREGVKGEEDNEEESRGRCLEDACKQQQLLRSQRAHEQHVRSQLLSQRRPFTAAAATTTATATSTGGRGGATSSSASQAISMTPVVHLDRKLDSDAEGFISAVAGARVPVRRAVELLRAHAHAEADQQRLLFARVVHHLLEQCKRMFDGTPDSITLRTPVVAWQLLALMCAEQLLTGPHVAALLRSIIEVAVASSVATDTSAGRHRAACCHAAMEALLGRLHAYPEFCRRFVEIVEDTEADIASCVVMQAVRTAAAASSTTGGVGTTSATTITTMTANGGGRRGGREPVSDDTIFDDTTVSVASPFDVPSSAEPLSSGRPRAAKGTRQGRDRPATASTFSAGSSTRMTTGGGGVAAGYASSGVFTFNRQGRHTGAASDQGHLPGGVWLPVQPQSLRPEANVLLQQSASTNGASNDQRRLPWRPVSKTIKPGSSAALDSRTTYEQSRAHETATLIRDEQRRQKRARAQSRPLASAHAWLRRHGLDALHLASHETFVGASRDYHHRVRTLGAPTTGQAAAITALAWHEQALETLVTKVQTRIRKYRRASRRLQRQMHRKTADLAPNDPSLFGDVSKASVDSLVVFVVDFSGSMAAHVETVKLHVLHALGQVPTGTPFNVLLFGGDQVRQLFDGPHVMETALLCQAEAFVNEAECFGGTNMLTALRVALEEYGRTGAHGDVFLLSDGRPDVAASTIAAEVDGCEGVRVNTVSFGNAVYDAVAVSVMQALAEHTRGRHVACLGDGRVLSQTELERLGRDGVRRDDAEMPHESDIERLVTEIARAERMILELRAQRDVIKRVGARRAKRPLRVVSSGEQTETQKVKEEEEDLMMVSTEDEGSEQNAGDEEEEDDNEEMEDDEGAEEGEEDVLAAALRGLRYISQVRAAEEQKVEQELAQAQVGPLLSERHQEQQHKKQQQHMQEGSGVLLSGPSQRTDLRVSFRPVNGKPEHDQLPLVS